MGVYKNFFRSICFLVLAALGVTICKANTIEIQSPLIQNVGAGARAFAMANNYVALANDVSATYYNPAGLAFTPVRELQFSLALLKQAATTTFVDSPTSVVRQRVAVGNTGYLFSIPTTRGGLTLAFTYQNPVLFDDNSAFADTYTDIKNRSVTTSYDYYSYGGLSLWSGAFGIQLAPGFGVGLTASLVTGSQFTHIALDEDTLNAPVNPANTINNHYRTTIQDRYLGFELRGGFLYKIAERLNVGGRFVVPHKISFTETTDETYPLLPPSAAVSFKNDGTLESSLNAAIGISTVLPYAVVDAEISARAPQPQASLSSDAAFWKEGAGVGLEIPLFLKKLMLRTGYSWNEFDAAPFIAHRSSGDNLVSEAAAPLGVAHNPQQLCAGIAFLTASNIAFEGSYGFTFWEISSGDGLSEKHSAQRILLSISTRF
ncbi:MAG: hypothetical protein PHC61_00540 [Chitinivibrionales bacterium]|nr:hypothetical protein [Chitinivibrionales bacterium]